MLKCLQAGSGVLIALFVAIHLLNTWLAALGPRVYDEVQTLLRLGYQFPPLEILLMAALLLHMAIGLLRIWREPKRDLSKRARLHRYAGLFLAIVMAGHIMAVRGASWFFDVYPGFAGLAFTVEALPGYFYPYYFLLGLAGFYHGLNGIGIALSRLRNEPSPWRLPSHHLYRATAAAGILTGAALLAFGGVWTDVGNPAHSDFAQLAYDLLGSWGLLGGSELAGESTP